MMVSYGSTYLLKFGTKSEIKIKIQNFKLSFCWLVQKHFGDQVPGTVAVAIARVASFLLPPPISFCTVVYFSRFTGGLYLQ